GVPWRVPRSPSPLANRVRAEHPGCSPRRRDHRLGSEDVDFRLPQAKPHRPGNSPGGVGVGEEMGDEDVLENVGCTDRFLCGLRDNRLVRLTVNEHLPTSFALVPAIGSLDERQAPGFKQVDRRINMASDVEHQILSANSHHVLPHVVNEIRRPVPAPPLSHEAVNRRETSGGGPAALDSGLLYEHDAQPICAGPISCFKGRSASSHASADNKDFGFYSFDFWSRHGAYLGSNSLQSSRMGAASLSGGRRFA